MKSINYDLGGASVLSDPPVLWKMQWSYKAAGARECPGTAGNAWKRTPIPLSAVQGWRKRRDSQIRGATLCTPNMANTTEKVRGAARAVKRHDKQWTVADTGDSS